MELLTTKKQLEKRVAGLLKAPNSNDRIFKTLENIFTSKSEHVLTRDMPIRHKIKRLAWRRFILGYPPRKDKDTAIGDALNWEYWWWNWYNPILIIIIGYSLYMFFSNWVHDMESIKKKILVVCIMFGIDIVGYGLFMGILGWI